MAKSKNYYQILGLTEKATAEEIKKSFRRLAREYHPDHNPDRPDAEEHFKSIQEAYNVLSDPKQRRNYDRYRKDPFTSFQAANGDHFRRAPDGSFVRERRSRQTTSNATDDSSLSGISNFFSRIFGVEVESKPPPRRGGRRHTRLDVDTRLRLSFAQALRGGKTEVALPHGEVVRINIPRGVRSGFKIRLPGKGKVSSSTTGDLYVTFEIEPHPHFKRRKDDLHIVLNINPFEAMLGTMRHVINAYGNRIKVKIPAGIQHDSVLRLKEQGVRRADGTGDMYAKIKVLIPKDLTQEQLKILKLAAQKTKMI